ncbi:hypothetical protein [Kordiimonas sp. SCSIO 12610]|uniref:hypothetical protein n=1 Tax=Kordiimonas sp. SCSIO 12610 TaxID=2829597 RepID=UPI00210CA55C|nr:hypothetical protein [Kordiimonas sp. SCSIO 12610]UTW56518.1 hypothetical protein KFF44_06345 [Kordiimonas sp. SCSIO 12610]
MKKLKVLLASSILATSAITGNVVAQDPEDIIKSYRVETRDCDGGGCGSISMMDRQGVSDFLAQITAEGEARSASGAAGGTRISRRDTQVVYLDFDSSPATFNVLTSTGDVFFTFNAHEYTQEERDAVQAQIAADYAQFNFSFTQTQPTEGNFTTLLMNCNTNNPAFPGPVGGACLNLSAAGGLSILFGQAESIDFRNLDMADDAFVDGNLWEFLIQFDPDGSLFTAFSGIPLPTEVDEGGNTVVTAEGIEIVNAAIVNQVANTAAHELGHILGLRHHDSFGALGDGIPTTGTPNPNAFIPVVDAGANAAETTLHLMASGASAGLSLNGSAAVDRFLSERSAIKIQTSERGRLTEEQALNEDRKIKLKRLNTPNTILEGENAGEPLIRVRSNVVQGRIDESGEVDRYFFKAPRGLTFLNAELVSFSGNTADPMIGTLRVFYVERNGNLTEIATNIQTFEPFDPLILDLQLPERGQYMIEVEAPDTVFLDFDGDGIFSDPFPLDASGNGALRTGDYELLMYVAGGALQGGVRTGQQ